MRITNAQINAIMHGSLSNNAAKTGKLMQQMATGDRIILPSDDPISSVRLLRIAREESSLAQYQTNIANLSGRLSAAETNLTAASDTILSVRDLLLWAANGTNDQAALESMAGELESLEETIYSYFNSRDEEGRFLFSGTATNQEAVKFDGTVYTLGGNNDTRKVAVANGVLLDDNVTAETVLGTNVDLLNKLHEAVASMKDATLDPAVVRTSITDAIVALDSSHDALLMNVTELGGRQNTLTLLANSQADISLVNEKIEGELSRFDYSLGSLELANYQMAIQATQKTYAKLTGMSLFDLL
ncbi:MULTISPECIES: flagellar hook-associated protein FlgL [Pseudomonas]|uniref:Flagellar hook-associated protein FlgL n=1 Tax=Serpens gallinarum TaxID=2763075 RepID=A0ABR8TN01_9PSED|nr:flagellar hook-associated protein FlgL [Serpens gallinarum]MBD7976858.1 flagellar hook-associated protein FlgL [Serpens gallinarum]